MPDKEQAGGYYPPVGFHFKVEFTGVSGADNDTRWQEVSGLNVELGIEEFKEGGENRFPHKFPNPAKYTNLVLKRGMLSNSQLIQWFKDAVESFQFKPANITVKLLDENHKPLVTWNIVKAYPIKWTTSDFKAMENSLVVESVELAYNYFTKQ